MYKNKNKSKIATLIVVLMIFSIFPYIPFMGGGNVEASNNKVIQVSTGGFHSLVLLENGDVYSFGMGTDGRLGHGDTSNKLIPTKIESISNAKAISAGHSHSLILLENGDVYSFGSNTYGEVGHGADYNSKLIPTKISTLSNVEAISAGNCYSLVLLENGDVYSFGGSQDGRLGYYAHINNRTPAKIESISNVKAISAGNVHSLVLLENGDVYSFGSGSSGKLGHGDESSKQTPEKIALLGNVKAISAGNVHSLVLLENGDVYSFGGGSSGNLGHGDTVNKLTPTKIQTISNAKAIEADGENSFVLLENGDVYSFGYGNSGQLGHGDTVNKLTPTKIQTISNAKAVSVGGYSHSLVLLDNGEVYSFGEGSSGQLGHGNTTKRNTPSTIEFLAQLIPAINLPTNFKAVDITPTSVELTWDIVENATKYIIKKKHAEQWENVAEIEGIKYEIVNLEGNHTYTYGVIAIQGESESEPAEVTFTTSKYAFNDFDVSINRIDDTTIEVGWDTTIIEGADYSLEFTGISPNIEYLVNKAIVQGVSNQDSYTLALTASKEDYEDKVIVKAISPPSQPVIIDINISVEDGNVIITWTPVSGATGYRIKINPEFIIDNPETTSLEVPLNLLNPNQEYTANITAIGFDGTESPATQGTFTTPVPTAEGTIIIRYQDSEGNQLRAADTISNVVGSNVYEAVEIAGYVKPSTASVSLEITEHGQVLEHAFVYTALTHELKVDPSTITINENNNRARIQWEAVAGADMYEVFINDARIGNTPSNVIQSNNVNYGEVTIRVHVIKDFVTGEGVEATHNYIDPNNIFENITFERATAQKYLMKWEGASSGFVELKQDDTTAKTANGRFNQAVLLQVKDGIYDVRINGLGVATLDTSVLGSEDPISSGVFNNVTIEQNSKGHYIVKWEGTTTANVELKQSAVTKYQVNGRFNQAIFVGVSAGTYDLLIGGQAFNQLVVDGEQEQGPPEQPELPITSNVTIDANSKGYRTIKWEGAPSAKVELKQGEDTNYTVNGRFNQATFTNLANGTYDIYIDGVLTESLVVENGAQTEIPSTPSAIENIQIVENDNNRILIKWEGPSSQTVSLKDEEGNFTHTVSGRFNQAVFTSVSNGDYTVFVGDTEGTLFTVNIESAVEAPVTPPEQEITNLTVEKNDRGTYFIRWEGTPTGGTVKLMVDDKVANSANGRFNLASFSKIYNGAYQVHLDGNLIGTIEIAEENNEASAINDTDIDNAFSIAKNGLRYLVKWTGGGSKDSLEIKQGEEAFVSVTNTRFRQAVVSLDNGIYELYIAGERKGLIGTHGEFITTDEKVVIIDPVSNDVVYRDSFEEIDQDGKLVKVYEVYEGSLIELIAIE